MGAGRAAGAGHRREDVRLQGPHRRRLALVRLPRLPRHPQPGVRRLGPRGAGHLGARWAAAVRATAPSSVTGRVVTYRGTPIDAVYFSSDGGRTENSEDVWANPLPYLRSVADPWSSRPANPLASWSRTRTQKQVAAAFGLPDVVALDLSDRTAGSVRVAVATSSSGRTARLSGAGWPVCSRCPRGGSAGRRHVPPAPTGTPSPSGRPWRPRTARWSSPPVTRSVPRPGACGAAGPPPACPAPARRARRRARGRHGMDRGAPGRSRRRGGGHRHHHRRRPDRRGGPRGHRHPDRRRRPGTRPRPWWPSTSGPRPGPRSPPRATTPRCRPRPRPPPSQPPPTGPCCWRGPSRRRPPPRPDPDPDRHPDADPDRHPRRAAHHGSRRPRHRGGRPGALARPLTRGVRGRHRRRGAAAAR